MDMDGDLNPQLARLSVSLPGELLGQLDAMVAERSLPSRSQMIAELIVEAAEELVPSQLRDQARVPIAAIAADLLTWPDYPIEFVPFPRSDREAAGSL